MRVLLDTHTLLWLFEDDERLSDVARQAVFSSEYAAVSIGSLWEIAIKQAIGKLELGVSIERIAKTCTEQGIDILPIRYDHLDAIKTLPDKHRDPFDRLIVAQAKCEYLTIVTKDKNIQGYDVQTIW